MTKLTCQQARHAIEARRFVAWSGLPDNCTGDDFGLPAAEGASPRTLGSDSVSVDRRSVPITGYDSPVLNVRRDSGLVVMFDGGAPELDGGWDLLRRDLGAPEAQLDYRYLFVDYAGGEWVYATRGITVFVNAKADAVKHIAVYPPTTVDDWKRRLRPDFTAKRLPRRGTNVPNSGKP